MTPPDNTPDTRGDPDSPLAAWVSVTLIIAIASAVAAFSGVAGSFAWLAKLLCVIALVLLGASLLLRQLR